MKKKKKVKIKYPKIILCLFLLYIIGYSLYSVCQLPISNIYITGNHFLKEQDIIELAGIEDYPPILQTLNQQMKQSLEKNTYIKTAKVTKKWREVHIEIVENRPLFYYQPEEKTILLDNTKVTATFDVPIVVNYIPDTKYEKFINVLSKVSNDVFVRISEIKYDPNEVDDGRFLLTMNDGNYVYVTLSKFMVIDKYVDIISKQEFIGKKGILKLDAGNSFEILQ